MPSIRHGFYWLGQHAEQTSCNLNTIALCFKTCNSYTPIILEIQNQASLMKWSYLLGDCNVNKAQVLQR